MMEAVIFMAASVNRIELKAQGRPNLANGISLYVSDDRKVATWSLAGCEYVHGKQLVLYCLLYTSPSPRDRQKSRMPSSA